MKKSAKLIYHKRLFSKHRYRMLLSPPRKRVSSHHVRVRILRASPAILQLRPLVVTSDATFVYNPVTGETMIRIFGSADEPFVQAKSHSPVTKDRGETNQRPPLSASQGQKRLGTRRSALSHRTEMNVYWDWQTTIRNRATAHRHHTFQLSTTSISGYVHGPWIQTGGVSLFTK